MDRNQQLAALEAFSERAAHAVDLAPSAPVKHCPGWSADDLAVHLAQVQWFWSDICERVITDSEHLVRPPELPDGTKPTAWLRAQTSRLVAALGDLDPDTPLWSWFAAEQTARFALRRQTVEAVIHCFDAEHAAAIDWEIAPDVAELGLQEFVDVMQHDRHDGVAIVPLRLEPTDGSWRGTLFADGQGDPATLALPLSDTLLALWGRHEVDPEISRLLAAVDLT